MNLRSRTSFGSNLLQSSRFGVLCTCLFFLLMTSSNASAATIVVGAQYDTQVVEGDPTSNFGTSTSMYVASSDSGSYMDERSLLRFNLENELPPGATITAATLQVFQWKADSTNNLDIEVRGSSSDTWTESSVTWNTQPADGTWTSPLDNTQLEANIANVWHEFDVTTFVQNEWSGDKRVSLLIKAVTEGSALQPSYAFNTREYALGYAPVLTIQCTDWPTGNNITIFHFNDIHGRLTPHDLDVPESDDVHVFETVGGAAYFTTKLMELKAANPNSLILDAGDISEGNPIGDLRGNGGMIDFLSMLDTRLKTLGGRGIDALVLGNHDIRDMSYLTNAQNSGLPFVSVNLTHDGTMTPYFEAYKIVSVNGKKIGILGVTSDVYSLGADLVNIVDLKKVIWEDNDSSTVDLKDWVDELRTNQNCDLVIMLVHIGHNRICSGDESLLANYGGVKLPEVTISGHWHTMTKNAWKPSSIHGKTLIDEAGSYLQFIAELNVSGYGQFVNATKHAVRNAEIPPDAEVLGLISSLTTEYYSQTPPPEHNLDEVIGYSAVDLFLDKDKWWTLSEFPWAGNATAGCWIVDAMVWKAGELGYTAHLALNTGGGIRRDVKKGWITYLEIYETYPWVDDQMVRIQMTGQEVWDFIEDEGCSAPLSEGWVVHADDGVISDVKYQGSTINLNDTFEILISEYMYEHEGPWSDPTPEYLGTSIREGIVEFTAQYDDSNPMTFHDTRYVLNTEFAGQFNAVVTMVDDKESQPYYEAIFVRLLSASQPTIERRGTFSSADLVNSDGSINRNHQFCETMLYRSHLGFTDGALQPGDIIYIQGEGGFHRANPQFVEQEGVNDAGAEFTILGNNPTLAQPHYMPTIAAFWDDFHENHYVMFYGKKVSDTMVEDSEGTQITVYKPGGYYESSVPGSVGDFLEIRGVQTARYDERKFRLHTSQDASMTGMSGFPPYSAIEQLTALQTSAVTLAASAADNPDVPAQTTESLNPTDDTYVLSQQATQTNGSNTSLYIQSALGGSYGNERIWLSFDLSSLPAGVTIDSVKLKLYCFRARNGNLLTDCHGVTDDTWTEAALSWNTQPASNTWSTVQDSVELINGDEDVWYEWDVTTFTLSELSGDKVVSLLVKAQTEDDPGSSTPYFGFNSKDWSSSPEHPKLEVTYQSTAVGGTVSQVDFYYRSAQNNQNWGPWTFIGSDNTALWEQNFTFPDSYGYYQFYSIATDDSGNVEPAPLVADTWCHYVDGSNNMPMASDPTPANNSGGVSVNTTLTVRVTDPDFDIVDVTFYNAADDSVIGTFNNVMPGDTATTFWNGLNDGTHYRWYVTVEDGRALYTSPKWIFITENHAGVVPSLESWAMIALLSILSLALSRRMTCVKTQV